MQNSQMLELHTQEGRVSLRLRALYMGNDLCILLDGGQKAHTGAIALAPYSENVTDNEIEILCLKHHREDELAKQVAQKIRQHLSVTVTCLCGIHIPNISKAEIALVYAKSHELVDTFLHQFHEKIS